MVMAQSLFITLKQRYPQSQIDVLAPAWSFPLLDRMPEVSSKWALPLTHGQFGFGRRRQLAKQLRSEGYDWAVLLPNSWKSALIPFFSDIPLRTGYVGECRWGLLNDSRRLNKSILTMTVQRFVALAWEKGVKQPPDCPVPKLSISEEQRQRVADQFGLSAQVKKLLALCPGAEFGPAKRWPEQYFADIARHYLNIGWSIALFGSNKDRAVTSKINQLTGNACLDWAGRTSLSEAIDLLSLADKVVTNDSGLMHIAAALDKDIVAVYGSSDPDFTPPMSQRAAVICLQLDCSPCFKRNCPLGHGRCLIDIKPEQVIVALNRKLSFPERY